MAAQDASGEDPLRRRAYELWESDGMREGEDLRYWLEAEKEAARASAAARAKGQSSVGALANENANPAAGTTAKK